MTLPFWAKKRIPGEVEEVKNLDGSDNCKKPKDFSSWRLWWAVKKGRKAEEEDGTIRCSNLDCQHKPEEADYKVDGGHVYIVPENDALLGDDLCYIVPLCNHCNGLRNKSMWVKPDDLEPLRETKCCDRGRVVCQLTEEKGFVER